MEKTSENIVETKNELIQNIKDWIKMDNDITQLKKELKEKNAYKKKITLNLVENMRNNKIDCFNITGGALIYKKNKIRKPINSKTLLKTLENYYKNDKSMADELTNYILENREIEIKETIKRKITT
jgi:hypothetical protein